MRGRPSVVVRAVVAVLVVLVTAAACGGRGGKPSPPTVSTADVAVTAAHGVTVRLTDGATLVIPPGAVSGNGRLTARISGPQEETNLSLDGQSVTAKPVLTAAGSQVSFELTGAKLVHPVSLTLPVDPPALQQAESAASEPDAAWLAFYNAAGHRWQYVDSRYDPVTHSVSAQVTHLSLWAPLTFAWQQIGTALRQALTDLLSERATLTACPKVNGVVISDSGGPDGPVTGCASQTDANQLTVTITSNRGYAMIVPTPNGVTPGPPEYTGYTQFLQTRPDAIRKLGGEYLAPTASLTYTMPLYGSPVIFNSAASVKTYLLDAEISLQKTILNTISFGLSDCILDNMANSGPLPLSEAPGLLVECLPIIGGPAKEAWAAFGDFLEAVVFAKDKVGAVLDLNGDAQANFRGTVRITRPPLPLPEVAFCEGGLYPNCVYQYHGTEPASIYFSGDNTVSVRGITWSSWNETSATGSGTWFFVDCNPDCASGPVTKYPATLTLSNAQNGLFTVLTTTMQGKTATYNFTSADWPQFAEGCKQSPTCNGAPGSGSSG